MKDNTKRTAQNLKKAFFDIKDVKKEIDLSAFNGPEGIYAKQMSMKTYQEISKKCTVLREGVDIKDAGPEDWEYSDDFTSYGIVASICDEDGNLIFSVEEIEQLQEKSMSLFRVLSEASTSVNTLLGPDGVEAAEKK